MPSFPFFHLTLSSWHPPYNSGKSTDLAAVTHHQWEKGAPGSQGTETSAPEQPEKGRDWGLFNSQQKQSGKEHRRKSGVLNSERWGTAEERVGRSFSNRKKARWEQEIQSRPECLHPFKGRQCAKLVKESRPRALEKFNFHHSPDDISFKHQIQRRDTPSGEFFFSLQSEGQIRKPS